MTDDLCISNFSNLLSKQSIASYGDIVVPYSVTMNCAPILDLSDSDEKLSFSIATLCPVQKELTTSDVMVVLFKIKIVSG